MLFSDMDGASNDHVPHSAVLLYIDPGPLTDLVFTIDRTISSPARLPL